MDSAHLKFYFDGDFKQVNSCVLEIKLAALMHGPIPEGTSPLTTLDIL